MSPVLKETLRFLLGKPRARKRRIQRLLLSNYFTVIQLEDASVGACKSYYSLAFEKRAAVKQWLESLIPTDPLLLALLLQEERNDYVLSALRACLANALSAPLLRVGSDEFFSAGSGVPREVFDGVKRAIVVGFGGVLDYLVGHPQVEEVHVVDIAYNYSRQRMHRQLARYQARHPWKRLTIAEDWGSAPHPRGVDLLSVTGSALCNDTLDSLLAAARGCPRIIVQGQSAAIHPKILFEKGVNLVITTLKPPELAQEAERDPTGASLRQFLEGGLAPISLRPKAT